MLVVDQFASAAEPVPVVIGESEEGRPIEMHLLGRADAPRRALVIAGQHGDEPLSTDAVQRVLANWVSNADEAIAFVPCLNPDGAMANTRTNATGIDLNRDHQRLRSAECRALHAFARDFAPQLVIDVHTFKARRRSLLADGFEWGADVLFELDNHPGRLLAYPQRWNDWIVPVIDGLADQGVRSDRYLISTPSGTIRTSSADIVDARNGLAARLEATGILLEGREPTRRFGTIGRALAAMARALTALLERWRFVDRPMGDRQSILHLVAERFAGGPAALAFTVTEADAYPRRRNLPGRPCLELLPARPIAIPHAYGVSTESRAVIELLDRHGFVAASTREAMQSIGAEEVALIESFRESERPGRAVRNTLVKWLAQSPSFKDRQYYMTSQPGGDLLAALLEPGSYFALHRYEEFGLGMVANQYYKVSRGLGRSSDGSDEGA